MNFANTVKENIPEINLAIFLNNLNTLGTFIKSFGVSNRIFNRSTAGQYDPKKNAIEFKKYGPKICLCSF